MNMMIDNMKALATEFLENGHHHKPIKYFKKGEDLFNAISRIDPPLRNAILAEIEATKLVIGWKD